MSRRRRPPEDSPARQPRWPWLLLAVTLAAAAGLVLVRPPSSPPTPAPAAAPASPPRAPAGNRGLCEQKIASLERYNGPSGKPELYAFFQRLAGRPLAQGGFETLNRLVIGDLLPRLFRRAAQSAPREGLLPAGVMAAAIEEMFPQSLLVNGDVVLFPDHPELRLLVAETEQDHLRDTAVHWRWILGFLEAVDNAWLPHYTAIRREELRELDLYAAEALSEFLSVMGVGVVQLAARRSAGAEPVPAAAIEEAYDLLLAAELTAKKPLELPRFDAAVKQRLASSFTAFVESAALDYRHETVPLFEETRRKLNAVIGIEGGGAAAGDYDGDGWDDLFLCGDGGQLFRNEQGRLRDVTAEAGLRPSGEGRSAAFVDYDNDGDQDLFLTYVYSSNRLWENDGHGRFTDVTDAAGLSTSRVMTHAQVWFDYDRDGLLDLYLGTNGAWFEGTLPTLGRHNNNGQPKRLYHHVVRGGRHGFDDVTSAAGVGDTGWTQCVGAWDPDRDGDPDLLVVNDFGVDRFYENLGGGRFADASTRTRLDDGRHGMNFSLVDWGEDGRFDLYVSNIGTLTHSARYRWPTDTTTILAAPKHLRSLRVLESNGFFYDLGAGVFSDVHAELFEPADLGWAWDASFFDADNDGDKDLYVVNGTLGARGEKDALYAGEGEPGGDKIYPEPAAFAEETKVFYAQEGGYFYDVSAASGLAFTGNSRGTTLFDLDHDGDLDVVVNNYRDRARLFVNQLAPGRHFVRLRLQGTRSNRDAVGAEVEVQTATRRYHDLVVSTSGFLSQKPKTLHFGLGGEDRVLGVTVRWPSGAVQTVGELRPDATHVIVEP